jgi:hypothetical protein
MITKFDPANYLHLTADRKVVQEIIDGSRKRFMVISSDATASPAGEFKKGDWAEFFSANQITGIDVVDHLPQHDHLQVKVLVDSIENGIRGQKLITWK